MQVAKQRVLAVVKLQTSSYLCSWVCLRTFCTQDLKSDDTLKNSLLCCRGAWHAAYLSCNPKTSGSFKGVEVWNEKLKMLETGWLCFTTLLVLPHPQKQPQAKMPTLPAHPDTPQKLWRRVPRVPPAGLRNARWKGGLLRMPAPRCQDQKHMKRQLQSSYISYTMPLSSLTG